VQLVHCLYTRGLNHFQRRGDLPIITTHKRTRTGGVHDNHADGVRHDVVVRREALMNRGRCKSSLLGRRSGLVKLSAA